jgi:hypothetical protein
MHGKKAYEVRLYGACQFVSLGTDLHRRKYHTRPSQAPADQELSPHAKASTVFDMFEVASKAQATMLLEQPSSDSQPGNLEFRLTVQVQAPLKAAGTIWIYARRRSVEDRHARINLSTVHWNHRCAHDGSVTPSITLYEKATAC